MRMWTLRSWGFAVASTFAVASGDEYHQTFLPSRTGLFSDVVLDTCGGILMSGAVLGLSWCLGRTQTAAALQRTETAVEQLKL